MTGSNKPHSIKRVDGRGTARAFSAAMLEHAPRSIHPQTLALKRSDRTIPPQPVPVWAWVDYGPQPVFLGARMVEWTDRACSLRWTAPDGAEHRAWVWRGAVEPRRQDVDMGPLVTPQQRGRDMVEAAARELASRD